MSIIQQVLFYLAGFSTITSAPMIQSMRTRERELNSFWFGNLSNLSEIPRTQNPVARFPLTGTSTHSHTSRCMSCDRHPGHATPANLRYRSHRTSYDSLRPTSCSCCSFSSRPRWHRQRRFRRRRGRNTELVFSSSWVEYLHGGRWWE